MAQYILAVVVLAASAWGIRSVVGSDLPLYLASGLLIGVTLWEIAIDEKRKKKASK